MHGISGLRGGPRSVTPGVTGPAGPAIANKSLTGSAKTEDLDGRERPVTWTRQVGPDRVLVSAGHYDFTFKDRYFRIIPLRATAWRMNAFFEPFRPLVRLALER